MTAEEKISWLNQHTGWRKWRLGDEVRCRPCGGEFPAERTAMDFAGEPTCPHCIGSTVADFAKGK